MKSNNKVARQSSAKSNLLSAAKNDLVSCSMRCFVENKRYVLSDSIIHAFGV